ncbi:MAG: succinate dehydrogenase, hydrophobic membrane anchor protein [Gammaproteobacteria bacterium]|nr:MAG: succinate dehydrogenase, hydrophobic membrane anchor protein [Gammaproteobacteria bacterium]
MNLLATGLRAWVVQRATALYLAAFAGYAFVQLARAGVPTHAAWRAWLAEPGHWVAMALAVVSLLLHAWVGMRDIVFDYVPRLAWRLACLGGVLLVLAAAGLLAFRALLEAAAWA